ncbi:MAG: efflux RND transporter periplasmic adaptor subunit [bacterium]|nr:efflux RND transporter periplasmic adaptor subunit [bacterium]
MRKKWVIIIVLMMAVITVFLTTSLFFSKEERVPANLRTAVVSRQNIGSSVLATGIIKPMVGAEVRVGSRVSGIVNSLHANIGDMVYKGQLIAELDPTELQAKYNQALAALENARANFEYSKLDLERQRSLLKQNFISQNQFDLAEKTFEINRAQLKQAEANLEFTRVQLGYTKITAPINGVVASVSTQEGETVAASFSAPTFVNIIDLDRLEVWAYVDETDIGRIQIGQRATFTVDTYLDTDFEGAVTAIYPKAVIQDNVVNYIATIDIDDFRDKQLRPEMTTTVTIYLETRKDVLVVPTTALRREQSGMVVTVLENGQIRPQSVQTGWSSGGYTEIKEGLNEGQKVVIQ